MEGDSSDDTGLYDFNAGHGFVAILGAQENDTQGRLDHARHDGM